MSLCKRIGLVLIWVVSLVGVAVWARAQAQAQRPTQPATIISGNDLGFRVEGRNGSTPTGRLVVRMNGQWVDVESSAGVKRLTAK
jgi:hypothetical protein